MAKKRAKIDKVKLVGRDPSKGLLAFKTGVNLTPKDKLRNRNSKAARKQKRKDIRGEE